MNPESHHKPGDILREQYRIEQLIASGGFGEVYKAFDIDMGRHVALKYIFRKLNIAQLRNEVSILARHANELLFIPDVYAHWPPKPPGIGYYIVMQFVDGETLKESKPFPPWPSEQVITFLRDLLANLRDLHSFGIVHCDIKPDNIKKMPSTQRSIRVEYMLLDFGIAKQGEDTSVAGASPFYAGPEQHNLGKREGKLDARADLYGLAATAYFLLTGKQPIDSRARYSIVFDLKCEDPLPRPSTLVPDVNPGLEETLLEMLQLDREQRPPSAAKALEDLERRLHTKAPQAPEGATEIATKSKALTESAPPRPLATETPVAVEHIDINAIPPPKDAAPPAAIAPQSLPPAIPNSDVQSAHNSVRVLPAQAARSSTPLEIGQELEPAVQSLAPSAPSAPQVPASAAPVAAKRGHTAELLDRQGHGLITGIAWPLDGRALLVGTYSGLYWCDPQTAESSLWRRFDTSLQQVGFVCAGQKVILTTGNLISLLEPDKPQMHIVLPTSTSLLPGTVLTGSQGRNIAILTDQGLHIYDAEGDVQVAGWSFEPSRTGRRGALSGDGQTIVVVEADRFWCTTLRPDLRGRQWSMTGLPEPLIDIALTPDGNIVTVAASEAVWVWRRGVQTTITHQYDGEAITALALSSDGQALAIATGAGVFTHALADSRKRRAMGGQVPHGVRHLAFSADGRLLAAATHDELWIWRRRDGLVQTNVQSFGYDVQSLALSGDEQTLVTLGGALRQWSVGEDSITIGPVLAAGFSKPQGVVIGPRGDVVVAATKSDVYSAAPGNAPSEVTGVTPPAQVHGLGFAGEGVQLVVLGDQDVQLHSLQPGTEAEVLPLWEQGAPEHAVVAADGGHMAVHKDGCVVVRSLPDGTEVCALQREPGGTEITAIALAPNGTLLAIADEEKLEVWQVEPDQASLVTTAAISAPQPPAHHLIFSRDGCMIASLHGAAAVIWRLNDDELTGACVVSGQVGRITDIAMTSNGARIITAAHDGTLCLWRLPPDV